MPGSGRTVYADRLCQSSAQTAVLGLELTDAFVGGGKPGPERWVRGALTVGDNPVKRGTEPVKLFETDCQEIFGATSAGCGLLIHAAPGSCGGVGALFTNRSGWAA